MILKESKLRSMIKDAIKRQLNEGYSSKSHQEEIVEIAKDNRLKDIIKHIDLDNMSPMQAFVQLQELIDISKED